MSLNRRRFLEHVIAASALSGMAFGRQDDGSREPSAGSGRSPAAPLNMLILGGTGFIGPHIVREAIGRGHRMTLFNRRRTNDDLFPELVKLRGNRNPDVDEGLSALEGRSFDVVVDTSGYLPRDVAASARLLAARSQHYVFVSSIAAYANWGTTSVTDESAPLDTSADASMTSVDVRTYGPLKAACERAAAAAMPGRVTMVRPGLIVGPGDHTDRFTYWPVRLSRGGEVLAPGTPDDPVQLVDARDLATWIVHMMEQRVAGAFNAVGPRARMTIAELLYGSKGAVGGDAQLTWVDGDFLAARGVRGWRGMPVWVSPSGDLRAVGAYGNAKAVEAGLHFRPLAETARDTLAWFGTLPPERQARLRAGISMEREGEILAAWRSR